jgi:hypothetical protein
MAKPFQQFRRAKHRRRPLFITLVTLDQPGVDQTNRFLESGFRLSCSPQTKPRLSSVEAGVLTIKLGARRRQGTAGEAVAHRAGKVVKFVPLFCHGCYTTP